jgi:hypothetical protein
VNLDRAAREAVERHDRLLHHKVLELVLGAMVAMDGVKSVRKVLLQIVRNLKYY